jgi:GT2 family glycosyltransferase
LALYCPGNYEKIKGIFSLINADSGIFMDISIIIVNWKSAAYLQKCLESIYCSVNDLLFEVVVIDNASYDGCDRMLIDRYPQVRFIQSTSNLGFAGANNLAFQQSSGKTLLFLNPDTEIADQAISKMHQLLWETANAGAIGCTLLNTDGTVQTSCVQAFPTILNQILDSEMLRRLFPLLPLWGTRPLFRPSGVPMPVDAISGACLMIKRQAFESAGFFSTDYFMYSEDIDLCRKVRSAGFAVYYTGAVSIVHHGGGSSNQRKQNYFGEVVIRESLFRYLTKFRGRLYGYAYRLATGGASLFRVMLLACLMTVIAERSSRESLRISLGKWINIFRWSFGFEKWARRLIHETSLSNSRNK